MNLNEFDLKEYERLIAIAKNIDAINYLDIVHDHLLTGKPMKGLKFDYLSVKMNESLSMNGTCATCSKCNQIKPISAFYIKEGKARKYIVNECTECKIQTKKERYISNDEYRDKQKKWSNEYYHRNKKILAEKLKEYRQRPEVKEARRIYNKNYEEKKKLLKCQK